MINCEIGFVTKQFHMPLKYFNNLIHTIYYLNVIPFVYILPTDKKENTYKLMFRQLKLLISYLNPPRALTRGGGQEDPWYWGPASVPG